MVFAHKLEACGTSNFILFIFTWDREGGPFNDNCFKVSPPFTLNYILHCNVI